MAGIGMVVRALFLYLVPLLYILFLCRRSWQKRKTLPPGPRNWPVLGALLSMSKPAHLAFHRLSIKYGPIVYLRLGMVPYVVVSSPNYAKQVLKEQDAEFASRPYMTMGKLLSCECSGISLTPYGPEWRQRRRICTMNLFSNQRFLSFEHVRREEVVESLLTVDEALKAGKPVSMTDLFVTLGMNHICRVLLTKRFFGNKTPPSPVMAEFRSAVRRITSIAGDLCPGDLIPALRPFDIFGMEAEMRSLHSHLRDIVAFLKQDRKKESGTEAVEDLFGTLLSLQKQNEVTENTLYALMWDNLVAGTDTSAATLEWAFSHLLQNPAAMARAQEELDSVVGRSRPVEASDIPQLPYLQAIFKETWRLNPPVPMLLPHCNESQTTLGGYVIPAKTTVVVNTYTIGRDPEMWPDRPHQFLPERFLSPQHCNIDVLGKDFELLPFGSGRRKCPGAAFGHALVHRGLAALLHAFNWSTLPGVRPEDIDMREAFGIVLARATECVAMPTSYRIEPSVYGLSGS